MMSARRLEHEIEFLGNAGEARHDEQRALTRKIADRAVDDRSAGVHDDLSGFECPMP
jgi:hypothetical protein